MKRSPGAPDRFSIRSSTFEMLLMTVNCFMKSTDKVVSLANGRVDVPNVRVAHLGVDISRRQCRQLAIRTCRPGDTSSSF